MSFRASRSLYASILIVTTSFAVGGIACTGDDLDEANSSTDASTDSNQTSSDGGTGGGDAGPLMGDGSVPPPGSVLLGWQVAAANIGLAGVGLSCDTLPVYNGPSKPAAGTVISGKRFEDGLDLSAGNIVIEKSCVRPSSVGRGLPVITTTDNNKCTNDGCAVTPALVTIRDVDIDGTKLSLEDAAYSAGFLGIATIQRTYIHHFGSGIGLMNTGPSIDAIIETNYVTDLIAYGNAATTGNHSDGFTIRDFDIATKPQRQLVVRNNRFDCDSENATGAFFIQTYAGPIYNVRIEGNLLEGEGYQLGLNQYGSTPYGNLAATNNRFSGTGYGPGYVQGGPGWTTWQDNFIANAGAADYKGKTIASP